MKRLLMAFAATAALAIVPASAGADPGSGPQQIEYSGCSTYAGYGTVCSDWRSLEYVTENKNSVSFFYHSQNDSSWTGSGLFAGCSDSWASTQKYHVLFKKDSGEYQVDHNRFESDRTIQCGALNRHLHCTQESAFHYANGEVRHDRGEYVCEPV